MLDIYFDCEKLQPIQEIQYSSKGFDKDGKHYEPYCLKINNSEPIEIYMTTVDYRRFIDNVNMVIDGGEL